MLLKSLPESALLSSGPSLSSKSFAPDVYQLFIVIFELPVPTTGEVALLEDSVTSESYFSYDSRTFACRASHVFLASPRSMDVLGL